MAVSLGLLHLRRQDLGEAEAYARTAYDFYKREKDPKGYVKSCFLFGNVQWAKGEPHGALPPFKEALELCRTHEDALGTATFLDRIATMHRILEQDEEASSCFQEALTYWEKLSIPDRQAVTLTNLGDIQRKKGDLSKAIDFHEQALQFHKVLKNNNAISALERELERLKQEIIKGSEQPE